MSLTIRTTTLFLAMFTSIQLNAAILYVDSGSSGAGDGSSWLDAYPSLQQAVANAQSDDEIWVKAGIYTPGSQRTDTFFLSDGVEIYGGFSGTETSRDQRDFVVNETILSCDILGNDSGVFLHGEDIGNHIDGNSNHDRSDNCFTVVTALPFNGVGGLDRDTSIDGFTITNGHADNVMTFGPQGIGGGMFVPVGSNITAKNLNFVENYSILDGGGLALHGNALIENVVFERNWSCDGGGFATTVHAGGSLPGGMLRNISLINNYAFHEGGGFHIGGDPFPSNTVSTDVDGCVIYGNRGNLNAAGAGGGGFAIQAASGMVKNCSVFNNIAGRGGGVEVVVRPGNSVDLRNITIAGNTGKRGGGLNVSNIFGSEVLPVSLSNTILWANVSTELDNYGNSEGNQLRVSGTANPILDISHSSVQGGLLSEEDVFGEQRIHRSGPVVTADPLLSASTPPYAVPSDVKLTSNSPLRDAGDPNESYLNELDAEGEDRLMGPCSNESRVDIGADEYFYPSCWNNSTQCHGDLNENGIVNYFDLVALSASCAEGGSGPCNATIGDQKYNACSDLDHDGDVDDTDLNTLLSNMFQQVPTNCSCGDPFPPAP